MSPHRPGRRGIVYLMYHELEVPGRSLCQSEPGYVRYIVKDSDFRRQIAWLKDSGWRGLSVTQALSFPEGSSVAITFDDGCETDLLTAAPLLRDANFSATFYISSSFLGKRGFLNSAQLRELADMGFEIGCHSRTHAYLDDLSPDQLHQEIVVAKSELEQITGRHVDHFSCPGGRRNVRVVDVARQAGYRSVATSKAAANFRHTDPFFLGRVAIMRSTMPSTYEQWCRGQDLWRLQAADAGRSVARRLLGNSAYDRVRTVLLGR